MLLQPTSFAECLISFWAWKWLLSHVGPFMLVQSIAVDRFFVTFLAGKLLLSWLGPFMLLQPINVVECFLTFWVLGAVAHTCHCTYWLNLVQRSLVKLHSILYPLPTNKTFYWEDDLYCSIMGHTTFPMSCPMSCSIFQLNLQFELANPNQNQLSGEKSSNHEFSLILSWVELYDCSIIGSWRASLHLTNILRRNYSNSDVI